MTDRTAGDEAVELLRELADAARSACDARQHPALVEALFAADRYIIAITSLAAQPERVEDDGMADEQCPGCRGGDKVPPGEYFHCPVCDAEWSGEDEAPPTADRVTGAEVDREAIAKEAARQWRAQVYYAIEKLGGPTVKALQNSVEDRVRAILAALPAATVKGEDVLAEREACARIADAFGDGQAQMADEEGSDEGLVAGESTARFIARRIRARSAPPTAIGDGEGK